MATIRSRIMEFIPPALMDEMEKLCKNPIISDNNIKVEGMLSLLAKYNVDAVELGPGTNRLAVLIDNYVFKIALDKWGQQDNANEFALSHELQPYVIKTYELSANHVITVCEYVTVISREEFMEEAEVLRNNLSVLAESYLLGDVGTVPKNFTNWGYRDNDDLVILDYAYIYPVKGNELLCSYDQTILDYDKNFHSLYCPACSRKYSFTDVRRKVTMDQENHEQQLTISQSYKLTSPVQEFKETKSRYSEFDETEDVSDNSSYTNTTQLSQPHKEESIMTKRYDENQEDKYVSDEEAYEHKLNELEKRFNRSSALEEPVEILDAVHQEDKGSVSDKEVNVVEIERETDDSRTALRIISEKKVDADKALETVDEGLNVVKDASQILDETSNWAHVAALASKHLPEGDSEEPELDRYGQMAMDAHNGVVNYNEDETEVDNSEENDSEQSDAPLQGEVLDVESKEADTVVFRSETEVTDNIVIRNEVEIRDTKEGSAVDELRNSLREGLTETSEERIEELSEEYRHLEEDEDNPRRGGHSWK